MSDFIHSRKNLLLKLDQQYYEKALLTDVDNTNTDFTDFTAYLV